MEHEDSTIFGSQYYHSLIRKYVIAFGSLFNDIVIQRLDSTDTQIQAIAVPIAYGPKEKFLVRLRQDPNLDQQVAITLPRMGFEITSMTYASQRKLSSTIRNTAIEVEGSDRKKVQYVPVPYDINFSLHIFVRHTEDGTQILENILPYFRPEFTTNINVIPEMNIVVDAPVVLQSVVQEDIYEGDYETRQALVYTLDFIMKGYLYGPVNTKGVINRAITNIRSSGNEQILERIVVTPEGSVIDLEGFGFSDSKTGVSLGAQQSTQISTRELRLYDEDASHYVSLRAPAVVANNYAWTLPDSFGEPGYVLRTRGDGRWYWSEFEGPFGPKSITIALPQFPDELTLFRVNQDVTVSRINTVLSTTGAGTLTFTIRHALDRETGGSEVVTGGIIASSNTTGNTVISFNDPSITKDSWVWMEVSNITGLVTEFNTTIDFL